MTVFLSIFSVSTSMDVCIKVRTKILRQHFHLWPFCKAFGSIGKKRWSKYFRHMFFPKKLLPQSLKLLVTVVEGHLKVPFSIVTTPSCKEWHYSKCSLNSENNSSPTRWRHKFLRHSFLGLARKYIDTNSLYNML